MSDPTPTIRVDKWLWHARFFKTRGLASRLVQSGKVRVNSTPISKPSRTVSPDDVLTFPKDDHVRVIKIVDLGKRRGPAPEAQALYEDLDPPKPRVRYVDPPRVGGRPTGRDLKAIEKFKRDLEE